MCSIDDHGQKVQQSAEKNNLTPFEFTTQMSNKFKQLASDYNISYTKFIRTTDEEHKICVQELWKALTMKGVIYKGIYEGYYSVRDECYYNRDELIIRYIDKDGNVSDSKLTNDSRVEYLSPVSGDVVKWIKEESYFFRLSQFKEPLLQYIKENEGFIYPEFKRNEITSFISKKNNVMESNRIVDEDQQIQEPVTGLMDLSISRTSFTWGIPVPIQHIDEINNEKQTVDDHIGTKHVIYVWLDALSSYISALGYGQQMNEETSLENSLFKQFWPADLHLVGKDIIRFHTIYWPAFLLAADIPLPKRVFAHGWWVVNNEKMSKSVGNVVTPDDLFHLCNHRNVDYVRFFLCSEMPLGNDGNYEEVRFINKVNHVLVNGLGNLMQRSNKMIHKYCNGYVPIVPINIDSDSSMDDKGKCIGSPLLSKDFELLQACVSSEALIKDQLMDQQLFQICDTIAQLIRTGNKYFDTEAPWKLVNHPNENGLTEQENMERLHTILLVVTEFIRRTNILISPFIPESSEKIIKLYNFENISKISELQNDIANIMGLKVNEPIAVFPRMDVKLVSNKKEPILKKSKTKKPKKEGAV